jgi:hypothetical protein
MRLLLTTKGHFIALWTPVRLSATTHRCGGPCRGMHWNRTCYKCTLSAVAHRLNVSVHMLIWKIFLVLFCCLFQLHPVCICFRVVSQESTTYNNNKLGLILNEFMLNQWIIFQLQSFVEQTQAFSFAYIQLSRDAMVLTTYSLTALGAKPQARFGVEKRPSIIIQSKNIGKLLRRFRPGL